MDLSISNFNRFTFNWILFSWILLNQFWVCAAALTQEVTIHGEVYTEIIAPILDVHCVACHGPDKQKGKLALHSKSNILNGGDSGIVFENTKPDSSLLYQRLLLPADHDDVMPPASEPRLESDKIELIAWWIALPDPFNTHLENISVPDKIQSYITLQKNKEIANHTETRITPFEESVSETYDTVEKDNAWLLCEKHCFDCHDEESNAKAGFSLSKLLVKPYDTKDDQAWKKMLQAIETGLMPPKEKIPDEGQKLLVSALEHRIQNDLEALQYQHPTKLRRLTRLEYNNRVRNLFGYPSDVIPMTERIPITRNYFDPTQSKMASLLEIRQTDPTAKGNSIFQRIGLQPEKTAESGFNIDEEMLQMSLEHIESYLGLADAIVRQEYSLSKSNILRDLLATGPQIRLGLLLLLLIYTFHYFLNQNKSNQQLLDLLLVIFLWGVFICQFLYHGPTLDLELAICTAMLLTFQIPPQKETFRELTRKFPFISQKLLNLALGSVVMCVITFYRGWDMALGIWCLAVIIRGWFFQERIWRSLTNLFPLLLACALFTVVNLGTGSIPPTILSEWRLNAITDRVGFFLSWKLSLWTFALTSLVAIAYYVIPRRTAHARYFLSISITLGLVTTTLLIPRSNRLVLGRFDVDFTPKSILEKEAKHRIINLMQRAYKIPPSGIDPSPYVEVYQATISEGESFSEAMARSVIAILISPQFIFRYDGLPVENPSKTSNGWKLAHRLSWFLWKGVPDETLIEGARNGTLQQTEKLKQQVRRMVKNPGIKEFIDDFSTQWLKLAKLDTVRPDPELFPKYYYPEKLGTLATSMKLEAILHFERILLEDRSMMEFLDSNDTYVNMRLAELYECSDQIPSTISQRKQWKNDQLWFGIKTDKINRGGLCGMAGTLTLNSFGERTSPVKRGIWTLGVLLNRPPPAPKIAASFKRDEFIEDESMRDRLSRHRKDAACATCHDIIDPIGFAMEEFDPIGRFRKTENGLPINSSGQLSNGQEFDNFIEWKSLMLDEKRKFIRGFVEKLMSYALGRKLYAFDRPTITQIVEYVENNGETIISAIEGICTSPQFNSINIVQDL